MNPAVKTKQQQNQNTSANLGRRTEAQICGQEYHQVLYISKEYAGLTPDVPYCIRNQERVTSYEVRGTSGSTHDRDVAMSIPDLSNNNNNNKTSRNFQMHFYQRK